MNRVLLTGASGFIGRHCPALLAAAGFEVHAVSSRDRPKTEGVAAWHRVNLTESGASAALIQRIRPTHLLHLAWFAKPGEFWTSSLNLDWVAASLVLARSFAENGGGRFVAAGTCAEYAASDADCVEDVTPAGPSTLYGTCKHAFRVVLDAFARGRFESAWGRIFHLYGPDEHPNRLVPSVINALGRREPALCTDGRQLRDFLHVRDVAAAFVALVDSRVQGAVNIGSGTPMTVADLVGLIGRRMQAENLIRLGARPTPVHEPARLTPDVTRLRQLGWRPSIDLTVGIDETIQWWRARVPSP